MRLLASILTSLMLLATPPNPYLNIPTNSIQPLQMMNKGQLATICTTFSINEQQKFWGTAAHCVLMEQEEEEQGQAPKTRDTFIGGKPTVLLFVDPMLDIAVLRAEVDAPTIPFGKRPAVGDIVRVYGYMWGAFSPTIFKGEIANLNVTARNSAYMIMDMRVGGGHSGSPILDINGQVISVMQVGAGGFSGGALYGYLDELLPYWQLP